MSVTLADLQKRTYEFLNLSLGDTSTAGVYGTQTETNRYKSAWIDDAIGDKTRKVIKVICETDGHPHRNLYVQTTTSETDPAISSLAVRSTSIPDGAGKPSQIRIRDINGNYYVAKSAPAVKIDEWSLSSDSDVVASNSGYYDIIDGGSIRWSGTGIKIDSYVIPALSSGDYGIPVEYRDVVVALVCGELYYKQGDLPEAGAYFTQVGMTGLQSISEGKTIIPELLKFSSGR